MRHQFILILRIACDIYPSNLKIGLLYLGNVLESDTDALILTIDGAKRGLGGNIASAFARRWTDDCAKIEAQIRYPLPLGRIFASSPNIDCTFQNVFIASTLHHLDVLSEKQKVRVMVKALTETVGLAIRQRIRTLAKYGNDRVLAVTVRDRTRFHARLHP